MSIYDWIYSDSPTAARSVDRRVIASIQKLSPFPHMGRVGQVEGTRELVVPQLPYIVVYEVRSATSDVPIRQVVHGAQDRDAD